MLHTDDPGFLPAILPKLCVLLHVKEGRTLCKNGLQQCSPIQLMPSLSSLKHKYLLVFKTSQLFKTDHADKLMGIIYQVIDDGCEDVINAWYPAFCIGLRAMNWSTFTEKLLPKVVKLAGLESTYVSRTAAANIVTAASIIAAEKRVLEKFLLHPYMELCQDSDVIIRKTALSNLKLIFQKVEPSEVERLFFAELLIHLADPNPWIRYIILDVILSFHKLFSTHCLSSEFVPLLVKEFENGWKDSDNWLLQNCGLAVNFLLERNLLQEEYVPVITKFFNKAFNLEELEIKAIGLRNIAPIIDMCLGRDPESTKYSKSLNELAIGPLYQHCILQSLPDIVKAHYKHKKMPLIRPMLTALMQNDDPCFTISLFRTLVKIISKVLSDDEDSEDKKGPGLRSEVFKGQVLDWIKEKWKNAKSSRRRDLSVLIELIPQCQECFPVTEYNDYFINEMVGIIKTGNKVEKKLASVSFCLLYFKNYLSESRNAAMGRILEMADAFTCFERMAVLCFIEVAITYFSRKFLAQNGIVKTYLSLAEDKVANIRIKFVSMGLKISKILSQEEHKSQLFSALTLLQNDMDKDVRKFAKDTYNQLKKDNAKANSKISEDDDQVKEKREQDLLKREKEVIKSVIKKCIGGRDKKTSRRRKEENGISIRGQPRRLEKSKETTARERSSQAEEEKLGKGHKGWFVEFSLAQEWRLQEAESVRKSFSQQAQAT
eukprot:TRINITY_DN1290_c0_g1_i15.p1 TRINITY_DN1290_c0_g1~~TRINITY_DN1290_c0_g1_i15.p1  ORF type:complete len:715 (-),score=72.02 TRINITY_DN1290_c0_g1_i15:7827-9971(-)